MFIYFILFIIQLFIQVPILQDYKYLYKKIISYTIVIVTMKTSLDAQIDEKINNAFALSEAVGYVRLNLQNCGVYYSYIQIFIRYYITIRSDVFAIAGV